MRNARGISALLVLEIILLAAILILKEGYPDTWLMPELKIVLLIVASVVVVSRLIAVLADDWNSTSLYLLVSFIISALFLSGAAFLETSLLALGSAAIVIALVSLLLIMVEIRSSKPRMIEKKAETYHYASSDAKGLKKKEGILEEKERNLDNRERKVEEMEKKLQEEKDKLDKKAASLRAKPRRTIKVVIPKPAKRRKANSSKRAKKEIILASKTGKRYHDKECILANRIPQKSRILFKSEKEAVKKGYAPCRVCMPGK